MTEKWEKEVHPEVEDNLYHSSLSFDIQTVLGELGQGAGCSGAPGGAEPVPPGTASCRNVCESRARRTHCSRKRRLLQLLALRLASELQIKPAVNCVSGIIGS